LAASFVAQICRVAAATPREVRKASAGFRAVPPFQPPWPFSIGSATTNIPGGQAGGFVRYRLAAPCYQLADCYGSVDRREMSGFPLSLVGSPVGFWSVPDIDASRTINSLRGKCRVCRVFIEVESVCEGQSELCQTGTSPDLRWRSPEFGLHVGLQTELRPGLPSVSL
jgi:hypothetical protein